MLSLEKRRNYGLVWQAKFWPSLSTTSFLTTLLKITSKKFSKFLNYTLQHIQKFTHFKNFFYNFYNKLQ